MTLAAGHAAALEIEDNIRAALPPVHAVIHVDPLDVLPPERRPDGPGSSVDAADHSV
jgi:divalent metal cation (Fe/Co/Zn/Cd) transporter